MGWVTLHSVALSYPEMPTPSERELMASWLDMFRDTITCGYCRGHFTELLAKYRTLFPGMLNSRQAFAVFTFRAHNAVNRRLNKPVYATVQDCMDTIQKIVAQRPAKDYRVSYVNHITRYWKTQQDITGIVALKKIVQMRKIEDEYISSRDKNAKVEIAPDVVLLPSDALENVQGAQDRPRPLPPMNPRAGFRLTATGFRLQR